MASHQASSREDEMNKPEKKEISLKPLRQGNVIVGFYEKDDKREDVGYNFACEDWEPYLAWVIKTRDFDIEMLLKAHKQALIDARINELWIYGDRGTKYQKRIAQLKKEKENQC